MTHLAIWRSKRAFFVPDRTPVLVVQAKTLTPTTPQEPVRYPTAPRDPVCHCEVRALRDAAISAYARSLPCCQRHLMTIAEIATTGEVQECRSRNDIKPTCHCEERALRPHVTSAGNLSLCEEPPLLPNAPHDHR